MKKKLTAVFVILLVIGSLLTGCAGKDIPEESEKTLTAAETETETDDEAALRDGIYTAEFDTDSSMFRVNEACDGKGTLTVKDGEMMIHISLMSKKIVNLYPGLAEDAAKDGAELLMPTEDTVTYSDGMTEVVYGFDVPVPVLEEEFDLALIGTKGVWYDHKVSVSNPEPLEEESREEGAFRLEDGVYSIDLTFEGGSGKAKILSPAEITVSGENVTAVIQWSSPNYDYMIVDGEKYLPVNTEGNSVFEIPVPAFDEPVAVTGDTVAMSTPHEIEYTLTFHSDTVRPETAVLSQNDREQTKPGLVFERSMELKYAENFAVDYCEGGYTLLTTVLDGKQFLIVPEEKEIPDDLADQIVVLRRPVSNLYLVASAVMDMFSGLDGLDAVTFSGQKAENWYIEEAREAMENGELLYAGKYNKPDYERIVSEGCSLAIENTMITHAPEVVEKLESFGIPVMIEYSSYESHPLGRVEWIKFFGALLGREEEAGKIFEEQAAILEKLKANEKTDKTAAFFFITSNGLVQVRQSSDYVPKMIELAGGSYVPRDVGDPETKRSTMNMQVEEFYNSARDVDFLIYNSSIDGGISSVGELLDKCKLLADFRAVKEGNVWCTTNDMYQQSLSIGYLMEDIHGMLSGAGEESMHYLFRLE